jgi:MFS family permease
MFGMFVLPEGDLLKNPMYRRLWLSILISSLGQQITMLAIPLAAALLLGATPSQMGLLSAMEIVPFVLFSLPVGVWLDRVRKLPIYIAGEISMALVLISVPIMWAVGWLSMAYLYGVALCVGLVAVTAGAAAQIVLTQVVDRSRLIEAHAKNALAGSAAEVAGPGVAGMLIKLVGAPFALLADACLLIASVTMLRRVKVTEVRELKADRHFGRDLMAGLRFVRHQHLLPTLAITVGLWQMFHQAALVVQILFAVRTLGLTEQQIGLCFTGVGAGTLLAGIYGNRVSVRLGPGPCLILGIAINAVGWLQLAVAPVGPWGVAAFVMMLLCWGVGAVFIFINFLALRQAVTPEPLLGRMTSIIRWMILIPAGPGALIGGYVGEHFGLRQALAFAGVGAALLAVGVWSQPRMRHLKRLPALTGLA